MRNPRLIAISLGTGAVLAFLATMWLRASLPTFASLPKPLGRAVQVPDACPPEPVRGDYAGRRLLAQMREPVLACGPSGDDETYRFIWTHAFISNAPLSVRLLRSGSRRRLYAARYVWQVRPTQLNTASRAEREVSETEWGEFIASLRRAGFWNMARTTPVNEIGLDGSTWVLEGRLGQGYHLVARWSPRESSPSRELALQLLRLAEFEDPEPLDKAALPR